MRLFVAIEIDDAIRREAVRLIESLRPHAPGLKWVRPESLHLTLKFIGEIDGTDESKLGPICSALDTVRAETNAQLEFSRLFWIPNPRRPTVFWMGIHQDDALTDLAEQINGALAPLGVEPEQRPFRPHLTLARFRRDNRDNARNAAKDARRLIEVVKEMPTADFGQMATGEFHLVQSELSPVGAKYTKLRRFGFTGAS